MYNAKHLFDFNKTAIFGIEELSVTCFTKGMAIDADGCPFAYHPDNTGLDDLKHAGWPGNWWALATEDDTRGGKPVIQKDNDPAPGYYVTTTSFVNDHFPNTDQRRYLDASKIPFFVLPANFHPHIHLGDIAWVYNQNNGKSAFAIFADAGPDVGEGSMYLAELLDINNDPRYGGTDEGIHYFIFNGMGKVNGHSITLNEINQIGMKCMKDIDRKSLISIFASNASDMSEQ